MHHEKARGGAAYIRVLSHVTISQLSECAIISHILHVLHTAYLP
jgi:hypothetical protein